MTTPHPLVAECRRLRLKLGDTQPDAARIAGLSRAHLALLEIGHRKLHPGSKAEFCLKVYRDNATKRLARIEREES